MGLIKSPEISVIMPAYNAENYIKEAIDSILNQTFTNFELIILNDNSTDATKDIILKYVEKDSRIIFIDKKVNVGPANLRNEGFENAKGEFIALLDADDIALPERLEKQITFLRNNKNIGVCGSWFTSFGKNVRNKTIKHPENHNQIKVNFLINCTIGNSTTFFRKDILGNNRFDKEYVPCEDYHLWSRLITLTHFHNIQETLVKYRIHDANISQTKINNVKNSNKRIKIGLLSEFGIDKENANIEDFYKLIEGEKGLSFEEIKTVCECYNILLLQNKKLRKFDAILVEKMLLKSLGRIIRKSKNTSLELIKYIRTNHPKAFKKIKFTDKLKMYFRILFK